MLLFEILWAMTILGLPVALLSWYLFNRLYSSGRIAHGSDYKTVKSDLSSLKKSLKKSKSDDFFEHRWMKFGGGFYGVTALATFFLIEFGEVWNLVFHFPGFEALFGDGLVTFVVNLLVNQFQNFISALVWFAYWIDEGDSIFVWIGVPYAAYLLGLNVAGKSLEEMKSKVDGWFAKIWGRSNDPE